MTGVSIIIVSVLGLLVAFLVSVFSHWLASGSLKVLKRPSVQWCMSYGLLSIGLSIALAYVFKHDTARYLVSLVEVLLLGILFETDRSKQQIFLLPAIALGSVGLIDQLFIQGNSWMFVLTGMLVGGLLFAIQYFFSRGKLTGEGDMYLGMALGLVFGGPRVLSVILISYVIGSLISLVLLLMGKIKRTDPIPLGCYLVIGSICILFFDHPWALIGL